MQKRKNFSLQLNEVSRDKMTTIISKNRLEIRKMADFEEDYQLMLEWLSDPQVLEYYEGRDKKFTLETIKKKYAPRVLGEERVTPCIIVFEGTPIGYLQYYELSGKQKRKYDLNIKSKSYGVDLFIGETDYWNRGLGAKILALLLQYLFTKLRANFVTIDPRTENTRAIRSYEKAGFKKVRVLQKHEIHEGKQHDNWLMLINRSEFKNP